MSRVEEAKQALIDVMIEEVKSIMHKKYSKDGFYSCGWVDYLDNDLVQYEIVAVYFTEDNNVGLVHKDGSEGATSERIYLLSHIDNIEFLESILNNVESCNFDRYTENVIISKMYNGDCFFTDKDDHAINFWKQAVDVCPEEVINEIECLVEFSKDDIMFGDTQGFVFNKRYKEVFAPLNMDLKYND